MNVEFACDVFAMREYGVEWDAELVGYLFVGQATYYTVYNLTLTLWEGIFGALVVCLCDRSFLHTDFLLKYFNRWDEDVVLYLTVNAKVGLTGKDVVQYVVQQFGLLGRSILLYNNIFELLQFNVNAIVTARELRDTIFSRAATLQELVYVAKHFAIFMLHVFAHLAHIVVIEL